MEDKNGQLLTEDDKILERWTEYCEDLYNYQINPTYDILGNKFNSCGDVGDRYHTTRQGSR